MRESLIATRKAAARSGPPSARALIGLDGFVDTIVRAVDKREDFDRFTPIETMAAFGERIKRAAGLSTNIELVPTTVKLGGNGPIMTQALLEVGLDVTYVGSLGRESIHPVFQDLVSRCAAVHSLTDPGETIAVEFTDGKVMLGQTETMKEITWEALESKVGRETLVRLVRESDLIALVNWTMIPHMTAIWQAVVDRVLPEVPVREQKPWLFVDLADPEKRKTAELAAALRLLTSFRTHFRTVLGLNRKEATEVSKALGLNLSVPAAEADLAELLPALAESLRLDGVVVHPVDRAAAVFGTEFTSVPGPYTSRPFLTTGAGDNFNAGFCTGLVLNLSPRDALTLGNATSGFYVRHGRSPSWHELLDFLDLWAQHAGEEF